MEIDSISELNRVLLFAKTLSSGSAIPVNILIDQCKNITIDARIPDHELSIDYAVMAGLLDYTTGKKKVKITGDGLDFIELNPEELFNLSGSQKSYLLRKCYLDGPIRSNLRKCLESFIEFKETLIWDELDGIPMGEYHWVADHMRQLGVFNRTESGYEVNANYVETIAEFINEPRGWTENQYLEWLKEKKELGDLAEQLVLTFERERLLNKGLLPESKCVRMIAKLRVNAGYDLESFNGKAKNMKFDRFIEVKGSKSQDVRFFWTPNEIAVAKELGEKYWIYYQGGVDVKNQTTKFEPILFQNPAVNLEKDMRLKTSPNGLIVEGKFKGRLKLKK